MTYSARRPPIHRRDRLTQGDGSWGKGQVDQWLKVEPENLLSQLKGQPASGEGWSVVLVGHPVRDSPALAALLTTPHTVAGNQFGPPRAVGTPSAARFRAISEQVRPRP